MLLSQRILKYFLDLHSMSKLSQPAIIVIGIAILGILIYIHYDLFSYLGQFDDLDKYGIETEAELSEVSQDRLVYTYPVEDTTYTYSEVLSEGRQKEVWNNYSIETLEQDRTIVVLYQKSDPNNVKVKTKEKSNTKLIIVVLIDALMLNFIAFLAMQWYRHKANQFKNNQS